MEFSKFTLGLILICCVSCSENSNSQEGTIESIESVSGEPEVVEQEIDTIPVLLAVIDTLAMDQMEGDWKSYSEKGDIITFYNNADDEYERWSDKLWGRCCTEADMRLSEHLSFSVSVSHDSPKYPWSNGTDEYLNTAFVFGEQDQVKFTVRLNQNEDFYGHYGDEKLKDIISSSDTIMSVFSWSVVNGYVKSKKTFEENRRIKEVEVYKNGVRFCNVELLDRAEVQQINSNFPFFRDDVIEIRPISFYEGTKYDDVCISAVQESLGYSCHPSIDAKKARW